LNDLHALIVSHGGGFMQYLDGKTTVTHIIASSLTPKKIVDFRKYRIVKPAWIVDSIKAGRCLPWDQYRVVDEGERQKVLQFDGGNVVSQVNNKARGYRDQTDTSWYTSQLNAANTQIPTPEPSSAPNDEEASTHKSASFGSHLDDADLAAVEGAYTAASHVQDPTATRDLLQPDPLESSINFDDLDEQDIAEFLEQEHDNVDGDGLEELINSTAPREDTSHTPPIQQTLTPVSSAPKCAPNEVIPQPQPLKHITDVVQDIPTPQQLKRSASPSIGEPETKRTKLTAEEHNAILLSDPHMRKSSTVNPEFLEQYYRESRLHHLSAWKAELKSKLQAQAAEKSASQQTRHKPAKGARRFILHVDFDSFFVAVSLKKNPGLKDKPACVAHGSGGGSEIASCNYPAREFGVKNGMWMKRAQELCPDLKVLPYDFPGYEAASAKFYEAMLAIDGIIQSVSIDEALIDVSALCLDYGGTDGTVIREGSIDREQTKADEIAKGLREKVKANTGCEVSVGIGGNILLAKVALRKAKPAGQYQLKPDEALSFLGELEVQSLPGVAWSIGTKLQEAGVTYVKDIRDLSKERLVNILGPKTGDKIWNYARGIDRQEVGDVVVRKSVSAEVNWGVRFETQEQAEEFVDSLCGELTRRLLREGVKGKQLTMKIMRRAADAPLDPPKQLGHGKCDTFNKSVQLGVATNDKDVLAKEALSILRAYGFSPGELRGLGVQMQKLEPIKAGGGLASSQRRLDFFKTAQAKTDTATNDINSPALPDLSEDFQAPEPPAQEQVTSHSQRHLHFKSAPSTKTADAELVDSIEDDPATPQKAKQVRPAEPRGVGREINVTPSKKPLNILVTQFILPTQVDPGVLAELPPDIRARLAKHIESTTTPVAPARAPSSPTSKAISYTALPSQSQLDQSMLDALPADIRAEIVAHYQTSPTKRLRGAQAVLPQSPRKMRTVNVPKKTTATRGRPRGGGNTFLSRLKSARTNKDTPTLTQSNFVATTFNRAGSHEPATDSDGHTDDISAAVDISEDFLAALPEDIRKEVLAQHRAEQLKRTGGLEVIRRRNALRAQQEQKRLAEASAGEQRKGERILVLPPRPARPSFTTRKLTLLPELREAVSEWYEAFREEGPYREDVVALGKYLESVVGEEGDMAKAVTVVKWMEWVFDDDDAGAGDESKMAEKLGDGFRSSMAGTQSSMKWMEALDKAKEHVRTAVKARGLGNVAL